MANTPWRVKGFEDKRISHNFPPQPQAALYWKIIHSRVQIIDVFCPVFCRNSIYHCGYVRINLMEFDLWKSKHLASSFQYIYSRKKSAIHVEFSFHELPHITAKLVLYISCCLPQAKYSHSRWGTVSKDLDFHVEINNIIVEVVIQEPQKTQDIPVSFLHWEAEEHLLDVCSESNWFFAESKEDPQQAVFQIRSRQKHNFERHPINLCAGDHTNFVRLLGVIHTKHCQIPAFLAFLQRWCQPCMVVLE